MISPQNAPRPLRLLAAACAFATFCSVSAELPGVSTGSQPPLVTRHPPLVTSAELPDVSSEYQRQNWGREEGFPDVWVWSILQTRDGYLWAATRGGLVRYDGESFKVYDRANTPALTTDEITALAEDTDGSLWIGTADGLLHLKNQRFTRFDLKELLRNRRVTCLAPGKRQAVWAGTVDGLAWIGRESGRAHPVVGQFSLYCTALQADDEGTLWAGSEDRLLRVSEETGAVLGGPESPAHGVNMAKSLALDSNGVLWGLFVEGPFKNAFNLRLFRREKSGAWTPCPGGDLAGGDRDVTAFLEMDRGKNWWFPTQDKRIIRLHERDIGSIPIPLPIPGDLILSGCADREGSLWFGTKFTGLWRLRPRLIQNISTESGLPNAPARVVLPARDGSLWIGTDAGLSRYANGACVNYSKSDGMSRNDVQALVEDASGTIWIGTGNGLDSIKEGRISHHRFHGPILENDVGEVGWNKIRALLAARDGSVWVGIPRGLYRLANGQDQFFTTNQLSHQDVRGLMEDPAGDIWIGTEGGGVNRWHQGEFTVFTVTNGLSSNHAGAMLEDREGTVWIVAEGGLNRWRDGRFTLFTTRQGLLENQINQIVEDNLGALWLGGDHGLYQAPLTDFDAVAAGRLKTLRPRHYAEADGMLSSLTSGGQRQQAGCKTPDGRLWFPTARGVATIDPRAAASAQPPPPPVVIQQVVAENRIIYGDDAPDPADQGRGSSRAVGSPPPSPSAPLRVAPGAGRVLEFHFSANTFVDVPRVRYKYRMEGYEEGWTDAGARRVAYFTGLPPGQYRFHVIAGDHNNIWNDTGAALDLYLAPFLYQTWWFRAGATTLLAGLIFLVFQWRIRELRGIHDLQSEVSLSTERARIAYDLHDGVGAGLTQLRLLAALADGEQSEGAKAGSPLPRIASLTEEITRNLRDIIWLAGWQNDTLDSLLGRLCDQAGRLFRDQPVELSFQMDKFPEVRLDPKAGQNLYLAANEALNNIARHARARGVNLAASGQNGWFTLVIQDDGCGFAASDSSASRAGGHGLGNMRRRIESIGGRFVVESAADQGTRITMTIPLPRP
jgi:ligand-binding sensor domain-containing protein/signal transduction histidine kinase